MANATGEWAAATNIRYVYVPAQDGACTVSNNSVLFDVRPVNVNGSYLARSFFPGATVLASLSRALDRTLTWTDDDRANVGIASLASFVAAFEVATFVPRRSA